MNWRHPLLRVNRDQIERSYKKEYIHLYTYKRIYMKKECTSHHMRSIRRHETKGVFLYGTFRDLYLGISRRSK